MAKSERIRKLEMSDEGRKAKDESHFGNLAGKMIAGSHEASAAVTATMLVSFKGLG